MTPIYLLIWSDSLIKQFNRIVMERVSTLTPEGSEVEKRVSYDKFSKRDMQLK